MVKDYHYCPFSPGQRIDHLFQLINNHQQFSILLFLFPNEFNTRICPSKEWCVEALAQEERILSKKNHLASCLLMYRYPDTLRFNVAKFGLLRWFWWAAEKVPGTQVLQQSRERWGICATKAEVVEPREATHTYNGWLLTVTWARQSSTMWTRNSSGGFWMFLTMRNPSKNTLPNMMLLDHQGYLEDPKVNFQGVSGIHGISDAARASECRLLPDKVSGVTTATTCQRYLGNLEITWKEARYNRFLYEALWKLYDFNNISRWCWSLIVALHR